VTARLDVPAERLARLAATLSPDERSRARRMLPPAARRAVASRGLLRELLGERLGLAATDVPLRPGRHGKPEVGGELRFNVAHSGDLAVFALAESGEVGVDVERIRPLVDRDALAAEILSDRERRELASLPLAARDAALLEAWTRKEAYLKGRGDGLHVPPRAVVVSVLPGAPPALLEVEGEPAEARRWSLRRLAPAAGYVGTIALAS
jgi:4'-phosphopantetheinyl transferase